MMFRSLLLHSVIVVACAAGPKQAVGPEQAAWPEQAVWPEQTYEQRCVASRCELQVCFQSSCFSTAAIKNQFPGMFISRDGLNKAPFKWYNDRDQCCPTFRIYQNIRWMRNHRRRWRAIVQLKLFNNFWYQPIQRIACLNGRGCSGTCRKEKILMALLVWRGGYCSSILGCFEFDYFEVDSYCSCKSAQILLQPSLQDSIKLPVEFI